MTALARHLKFMADGLFHHKANIRWWLRYWPMVRILAEPKASAFHRKGLWNPLNYGRPVTGEYAKVAAFGLPKSGTTWLTSLLADLFGLGHQPFSERKLGGVVCAHEAFTPQMYFRSDILHAAYIMRDMRDVVVSYYHYVNSDQYHNHMHKSAHFDDIKTFYYRYFLPIVTKQYEWTEHANEYVERGAAFVKYEDLWDDTKGALTNILKTWGVDTKEKAIEEAIERNRLEKLQKSGMKLVYNIPTTHFRKGGYGGYKKTLPPGIVADIETRFGDYLRRWGYSVP